MNFDLMNCVNKEKTMTWHHEKNGSCHNNMTEDHITCLIVRSELTAAIQVLRQRIAERQPISAPPLAPLLFQSAIHQHTPTAPDASWGFIRSSL